jgi:3-oxoadipate CoA-transferase beta subunit
MKGLSRHQIAHQAAHDITEGWYVNLGIGMPTLVADSIHADQDIFLHTENGILNFGPGNKSGTPDSHLINASKQPISLRPGAAVFDSALSFAMMRGGHLDLAILGAYEVAANGDLANWTRNEPEVPPAVGGAMELAYGARQVWVLMEHTRKDGGPRIVQKCSLPLTASGVVKRIYTDLAILDIQPQGLNVRAMLEDITFTELQNVTDAPLLMQEGCVYLSSASCPA